METSDLWTALATALLGLLGVGVGALLTQRAQHKHWLRERKITAVSAFVENTSLMVDRFRHGPTPPPEVRVEWLHAIQSGRTTIHLLCDQPTVDAAEKLAKSAQRMESDPSDESLDVAVAALREFVALARGEIQGARRRGL